MRENYDNGYYVGEFQRGFRHGQGTYYWRAGNRYSGEWYKGDMHGFGAYYYNDGSKYIGEFCHDKRQGRGKYCYADGSFYEGEFVNDERTGNGRYVLPDGSEDRNGSAEFAKSQAKAEKFNQSQSKVGCRTDFVAATSACKKVKKKEASQTSSAEDVSFSQITKSVKNSSQSAIKCTKNNDFCNNGKDFVRQKTKSAVDCASRALMFKDGSYTGKTKNGVPHGTGNAVWNNGDEYDGEFENGKKCGKGVYSFADGRVYSGEFLDDEFWGIGRMTYSDGSWYYGQWQARRSGYGVYYNGNYIFGVWKNDVCETYRGVLQGIGPNASWQRRGEGEVLLGNDISADFLYAKFRDSAVLCNRAQRFAARYDYFLQQLVCGKLDDLGRFVQTLAVINVDGKVIVDNVVQNK